MSNEEKPAVLSEPNSMDGNLLKADDVAEILRVPKSWVYSHLADLPVIRLGRYVRFKRGDIDQFLEKRGTCE